MQRMIDYLDQSFTELESALDLAGKAAPALARPRAARPRKSAGKTAGA
jgi:hypothetical protein